VDQEVASESVGVLVVAAADYNGEEEAGGLGGGRVASRVADVNAVFRGNGEAGGGG